MRAKRMRIRRGGARRSRYFRHTPGAGRRAPAKAEGAAASEFELLCGSGLRNRVYPVQTHSAACRSEPVGLGFFKESVSALEVCPCKLLFRGLGD